ncbi:hypothetical protein GGD55_006189 [Rhizobium giardinii]|uniref:Uncharacterized protein n=1 Tax=Rhizobium giardinii TaxID=56731 RepID=A0A7W8UIK7_9HYPH|nr:hypothetical protein [Rhizobium giardinii]
MILSSDPDTLSLPKSISPAPGLLTIRSTAWRPAFSLATSCPPSTRWLQNLGREVHFANR